ncbi:hypothetical protein K1T71_013339 [Dendrolimus kikuchii]|uniref:Uncharacterized protein n=1 Tax=Dendrolimus kikuchii TaxID=765133 RepID=A0ACC1CHS0_9NEOP|nr:hypothetical protein K1T71_013339 [Dendrolimus kikuchii]
MASARLSNSKGAGLLKLSLKKNRRNQDDETKKINRNSDVIVLDESFDRLVLNLTNNVSSVQSTPKMYSPIVIQDSSLEESLLKIMVNVNELNKNDKGITPSKSGKIFDCKTVETSPDKTSEPSYDGWSPAQNIITTAKHDPIPSTPKENANKSVECCTIPKIQKSQIKLLNDLYGDVWKSIPKLFKTTTPSKANFDECTKKLNFDDDNKENIQYDRKLTEKLLMTESDTKKQSETLTDTEKKSRRKLYTEKDPNTLEIPKLWMNDIKSTTKKLKIRENDLHSNKELFLTNTDTKKRSELLTDVEKKSKKKLFMENATNTSEIPEPRVKNVKSKSKELKVNTETSVDLVISGSANVVKSLKKAESAKIRTHDDERLSFMASLADAVPSWRCDIAAIQYRDNFDKLKEKLTQRLFAKFNKCVFDDGLHAKMPIRWDTKFRSTAGTATNRRLKTPNGEYLRVSSIKLSTKVVDSPQRLRDTLIHELCHAATWVIDGVLKAGHGPLWKKWAARSLKVFPELGEISRCHDMVIHFKYSYRCTICGLCYQRHSKSIDTTMKRCGACRGTLELLINKKTKDGVVSTPARKGNTNGFALYVKENYAAVKDGKTHAQVMKILGEEFSAKKIKPL